MKIMRFTEHQEEVKTYDLGNGERDVLICLNERKIEEIQADGNKKKEYEYDGNIFRTCKLTEEDIKESPETYINYPGDEPPTEDMVNYANELIDMYTMQLMADGMI